MVQNGFCSDPFFNAFTDVPSEWGTRFGESTYFRKWYRYFFGLIFRFWVVHWNTLPLWCVPFRSVPNWFGLVSCLFRSLLVAGNVGMTAIHCTRGRGEDSVPPGICHRKRQNRVLFFLFGVPKMAKVFQKRGKVFQ